MNYLYIGIAVIVLIVIVLIYVFTRSSPVIQPQLPNNNLPTPPSPQSPQSPQSPPNNNLPTPTPNLPQNIPSPAGVTNSITSTNGGLVTLLISPAKKYIAGVFGDAAGVFGLPQGATITSYDTSTYTVQTPLSKQINDVAIHMNQQSDGNFVIYSNSGAQYDSNGQVNASPPGPFTLTLDDNGNLTTTDSINNVVWVSTSGLRYIGTK